MSLDYSRIHRLLKIVTLIQGRAGRTAEQLADECGVHVRTIFRDLKMLEGAGIPYFHDVESGGYRLRPEFFMRPVELTLDEALAITCLCEQVGRREQIPMLQSTARAVAKVRAGLPVSIRRELASLDQQIELRLAKAGPFDGFADVYEIVRQAIAERRVLRCEYESVEASRSGRNNGPFEFRPYSLNFNERAWYVFGHHDRHKQVRCLKLNRFSTIELTDVRYRLPAEFRLDGHLGLAWRMIRGDRRYHVELWFDNRFAETIADTHWHSTQEVEWHADNSITFRCTVDGLDEIVWWVLSMGPHCVVRKPKALAERVRRLVEGVVANYPKKTARSLT